MAQPSLGLIETVGLVAAVEAADAAVKSANVVLVGYELTRGDGMTVVKIQGEIGAVNAAVAAAVAAATRIGRVASSRVIARPANGVEAFVINPDTVGAPPADQGAAVPATPPEKTEEKILSDSSDALAGVVPASAALNPEVLGVLVREAEEARAPDRRNAASPQPRQASGKLPIKDRKHRKTKE